MNTNTNNPTDFVANMDDLQAEHAAEKAAAEAKAKAEQEAQRELDRIERNKVEAVARAKRNAERSITLRKIAACVKAPAKAEVVEADGKLVIDGVDTTYQLDFVQERTRTSSWRSTPNGKMRLTVGGYGERVSFPQRKDGSHNYEEIARLLTMYAMKKNAEAIAADNRRSNAQQIPNLVAELFPNHKNGYQDVITASSSPQAPVCFRFKINHAMSPDRARALAAAIRAAGIKLHYND